MFGIVTQVIDWQNVNGSINDFSNRSFVYISIYVLYIGAAVAQEAEWLAGSCPACLTLSWVYVRQCLFDKRAI